MLHSILKRRVIKPTFIAIENGAGFAGHPHKSVTERALRWIGYRIIQWQKTLDAKQAMGITRARWLRYSNPSPCTDASQAFPCVECDSHSRHQP